jgi:hypothetical protein
MKKKYFFILFLALSTTACNQNSTETTTDETQETLTNTDEKERFSVSNNTTIEFAEYEHHFGKVFQNTDNLFVFKVKNTGNKPLIIENVSASCGCTIPQKPDKPINPGETGKVSVIFHPSLSQEGNMSKTVTVEANTEPKITQLKITAEVLKRMM